MLSRIMIVDDQADQLLLLRHVFKMVDAAVVVMTAESGDEALSRLRTGADSRPDVILLDLRMPGKDGKTVLAELKADAELKAIPVGILSHGDVSHEIQECYRLGAKFYFRKPVGIDNLKKLAQDLRTASWSS